MRFGCRPPRGDAADAVRRFWRSKANFGEADQRPSFNSRHGPRRRGSGFRSPQWNRDAPSPFHDFYKTNLAFLNEIKQAAPHGGPRSRLWRNKANRARWNAKAGARASRPASAG